MKRLQTITLWVIFCRLWKNRQTKLNTLFPLICYLSTYYRYIMKNGLNPGEWIFFKVTIFLEETNMCIMIILVDVVLRRTVWCDWHFDKLCWSHLHSQVKKQVRYGSQLCYIYRDDHNTHIVSSRNIVTLKNIYQLLQTKQSISFHRRQETILV